MWSSYISVLAGSSQGSHTSKYFGSVDSSENDHSRKQAAGGSSSGGGDGGEEQFIKCVLQDPIWLLMANTDDKIMMSYQLPIRLDTESERNVICKKIQSLCHASEMNQRHLWEMTIHLLCNRDMEAVLREDREALRNMQKHQPRFTDDQKRELSQVHPWIRTGRLPRAINISVSSLQLTRACHFSTTSWKSSQKTLEVSSISFRFSTIIGFPVF